MYPKESEVFGELVTIDIRLQFALFGLECALGVSFSGDEWERVFRDVSENQVSAMKYMFFESPGLVVSGRVDEYEPDSIWLRIQGGSDCGALLQRVVDGAAYQAVRLGRSSVG